jgi:uncharacterized membrane protein required for colicin V production
MTLAGFHFGIIDISLIVLSLLFAISGFKNGFLKEVVGFGFGGCASGPNIRPRA